MLLTRTSGGDPAATGGWELLRCQADRNHERRLAFRPALSRCPFRLGLAGGTGSSRSRRALVIIDVLSFTTSVTVAVSRGTIVYPHRWPDPGVEDFAASLDAVRAVHRDQVSASHPWSLSPAHLLRAPAPERLVLPSPNVSFAIAAEATARHVVAGCLRNATAVARWPLLRVRDRHGVRGRR
jgi:hypothetical protein